LLATDAIKFPGATLQGNIDHQIWQHVPLGNKISNQAVVGYALSHIAHLIRINSVAACSSWQWSYSRSRRTHSTALRTDCVRESSR
jgi:hypothetical protein